MDGSAEELVLDEKGICNFCKGAEKELKSCEAEKGNLSSVVEQILKDGKGKKYDVLIGLSGGADSSTALWEVVKLGLRPLCFSIDNGWNDPKADENIMRLVEGLEVPFYRYTIDNAKFLELQGAFMRAGVVNLEIPTDHILMASAYEMAAKYGIKWIISGGNMATESIMPASWSYSARDLVHIKDIYKKFTGKKLKGLPVCSLLRYNYYKWVKKIKTVYLLDYLDYNREKAIKSLSSVFGYKDYYAKHCESIFTWWFQSFYLFEKFGIDKRKAHLSSLIMSKQITRGKAEEILALRPDYPKIGLEEKVMTYEKHKHTDYKTDEKTFNRISKVVRFLRKYAIVRRLPNNIT